MTKYIIAIIYNNVIYGCSCSGSMFNQDGLGLSDSHPHGRLTEKQFKEYSQ